jgi:methyl-accepting chemotaxis protein
MQGMQTIQEKMEAIASTVVRLSERSHAIGEITASVAGLAEQSNLLAVNAAIEAAKAGEHGKGFAVVAQEVKSLAEQSRQATRQVREILGDIQKSVGAAVMITEQGAKTVAQGVDQVGQASRAIRDLADNIADAAQAAVQIAVSSQQQQAGMDQVALAMENIQQASAENAAGSRQAEASARNLHALGQSLRQIVDRFQL